MTDMPLQTMPAPGILTPWSLESIAGYRGVGTIPSLTAGLSSGAWPVANTAYIYGFSLNSHEIARKLLRLNGATLSGTVDLGIYDGEGRLIVSTTPTAAAGTNAIQEFNIADTHLGPGRYWLAAWASATGATIFMATIADENLSSAAIYAEAVGGSGLPASITPALSTAAAPPFMAIGIQFAPSP